MPLPADALVRDFDRIVFHFDGNNNDPDDIAAIPVAALLADAAGIGDKTTFFYGNNLSEPNAGAGRLAAMDASGSFAEGLGIESNDYQDGIANTTAKLIALLETGDRVLMIEGGPMEAAYRALESIDPDLHENITLLSHSSWNENRSVKTRDTDGVNDGVIQARTWADLKEDFPDLTFIDIRDQNDGNNNNKGFNNSGWTWMDDVSDPVIQQARLAMEAAGNTKKNDPSDAGMLFYALTGEDAATPEDALAFLAESGLYDLSPPDGPGDGPDPDPTPVEAVLWLIDPVTDARIRQLTDGDTIDPATLSDGTFSVEAVPPAGLTTNSAVFSLDGQVVSTENVVPYALFGDQSGNFAGEGLIDTLGSGPVELSVTFYSGANGTGTASVSTISVSAAPETPPLAGDNDLSGGTGDDLIRGDTGNDTLSGNEGKDRLFGDEDEDQIFGGAGNDRIFGGDDNDTIEGGTGDDELFGNFGADLIFGGDDDDLIAGNAGADVLYGGDGEDTINGNEFADVLYGGANQDTLNGGSGLDALFGGGGADVLNGGASSDQLTGGAGGDTFEFTVTGGIDRITDWQDGVDKVDFTADGLDFGDFAVSEFGGGAGAKIIGGGYIVFFEGMATTDIDATDFL